MTDLEHAKHIHKRFWNGVVSCANTKRWDEVIEMSKQIRDCWR